MRKTEGYLRSAREAERALMERRGRGEKKTNRRHKQQRDEESVARTRRDTIDSRLKDHRELVNNLFAKEKKSNLPSSSSVSSRGQVTTLQNSVHAQSQALSEMNLVPIEAGALNINEQNQTIQNR